ncbi:hypothetical protein KUTeg_011016 [Tegillarca granosa]|uniref:C2H2-type domain-containing protein n=1 Tax=Tegillarca granosa TaxID=220873 RepID=A0ABQ9F2P5_TEGGR|nr:hypothetical protein KUTeg_011016 [Tegillarca granosa]
MFVTSENDTARVLFYVFGEDKNRQIPKLLQHLTIFTTIIRQRNMDILTENLPQPDSGHLLESDTSEDSEMSMDMFLVVKIVQIVEKLCHFLKRFTLTANLIKEIVNQKKLKRKYKRCVTQKLVYKSINCSTRRGSDMTYICPFCDKVFSKTIYLSDHLYRIHNEKRSICRICKQFFKTKMELRRHLSVHNLKNPNTCNLCGKFFTSLSEKLEHKRSHTSKPEYICEFCGKVFGRGFDLNIHRRIHSGEKPFLCSICDASFVSKSRLISHERVHTTSRPHLCDICGQSFKILPALSRHKRRHTNESEKFKCEHCEREFLSTEGLHGHLLHQHINLIDLSKINFKYRKCEYCDQIFAQKHKYDRHIIGHTGQNPVSCEICGKGYPNVASLNRHKYSHNSVKRFWCDICESGTNSKTKLKKHFNSQKHRSNCEKKGVLIKEERGRKTGLSELIEIASKEILETRNMSSDSRIIQPLEISSNGSLTTSALQETDKERPKQSANCMCIN